jgi:hypothetical protein
MGESSIHPAFRNVTGLPNFSWTHLATGASEYLATKNQSMAGAVHGWTFSAFRNWVLKKKMGEDPETKSVNLFFLKSWWTMNPFSFGVSRNCMALMFILHVFLLPSLGMPEFSQNDRHCSHNLQALPGLEGSHFSTALPSGLPRWEQSTTDLQPWSSHPIHGPVSGFYSSGVWGSQGADPQVTQAGSYNSKNFWSYWCTTGQIFMDQKIFGRVKNCWNITTKRTIQRCASHLDKRNWSNCVTQAGHFPRKRCSITIYTLFARPKKTSWMPKLDGWWWPFFHLWIKRPQHPKS